MRADRQRLDKWLWFARFVKSRSLSTKLVESGFVRVNGERCVNAAKALAVGDVITVALDRATLVVRVANLGVRRGPASEAGELYICLNRDDGALVSEADKG